MWSLLEGLLVLLGLVGDVDSAKAKKFERTSNRALERLRWPIYGLILVAVLLLVVAGVALLLTP
jgi:TRAP-type mannitol/chloroaromatic compound transport system permease small subunit